MCCVHCNLFSGFKHDWKFRFVLEVTFCVDFGGIAGGLAGVLLNYLIVREAMDHLIMISKPISLRSARLFEYTPDQGLTFKGYKRESIADLKSWLAPSKRKNSKPFKKAKDWWLAQLRLYGIVAELATTVPELTKMLTKAVKKLKEPTEAILALEKLLERAFLIQKAEDEELAFWIQKTQDEKLLAGDIGGGGGRRLGEAEERAAKRRKVEKETSASWFKDVEGYWSIECPKMNGLFSRDLRYMSIFFLNPRERKHHINESVEDDDDGDERDVETSALVLTANFYMGLVEGVLRSSKELPPDSTCFPIPRLPITWRGRDTMQGELQLPYKGDANLGSITFLTKGTLRGIFNCNYGKFPFTADKRPAVRIEKHDHWDELSEGEYDTDDESDELSEG
ncbi:hypothetical protein KC19_2G098300 [Ceratodon purpureus]|uniref:Uncharacterized protein n=1 Tax=Ceratodon purpureus TaxID=3225 RepID=A0A8T0ITV9_CERPU|nr:hypothetical protein KC19_2G098300 [Ceratodon purpureus]